MASVIRGSDNFDSLVHQGIGVNQTWQDVTASRSAGTTYTNTTGKPIMLAIRFGDSSTGGGSCYVTVDGIQVGYYQLYTGYDDTFTCIVPNGSTYSFTLISMNMMFFRELR